MTGSLAGPNKPMGNLTYADWDFYLERLNKKLAILWPIAYPHSPVPKAYRPELKELLYALTEPTPEENGITGKLPVNSGVNSDNADEVKRYASFGKENLSEGPFDVDDSSIELNARGIRNLTGNIRKQTSDGPNRSIKTVFGAHWASRDFKLCRSDSVGQIAPILPNLTVGLRVILK
jgi:hypothetical protein